MNKQNFRPENLQEFIGKDDIKNNLQVYIDSAKKRNSVLDHILLHGQPGCGKTTLSNIIANEFDKKIKVIQGTCLKKNIDLINLISLLCHGDFIFIDEIHAMSEECFETLYSVLEDFAIDITIGKDNNKKVARVSIPHFCLIGATTRLDKIPKPLEERFGINIYLDIYSNNEIFQIIKRTSEKLEIALTDDELDFISINTKGVPRIANNLLKRVNDFKTIDKNFKVNNIFKQLKIYELGLHAIDIKYLIALNNAEKAIGIRT
ncbi:MAG: Holliday junction branch migration DNA helicase RuvB, partial [Mycoplasma sp.]